MRKEHLVSIVSAHAQSPENLDDRYRFYMYSAIYGGPEGHAMCYVLCDNFLRVIRYVLCVIRNVLVGLRPR